MARTLYAHLRTGDTAGSLLRRARGKRRASQREMATHIGVTHTTIGGWESGRINVATRRIRDVAAGYGIRDLDLARALMNAGAA